MLKKIRKSADYIANRFGEKPKAGVILGTGLGTVAHEVEILKEIDYADIPNFPSSSVAGHRGKLLLARHEQVIFVIMQGRVHYYEGYPMEMVTFPIRVLKELGIEVLILSNAAGGLNSDLSVGDLMIITDHINLIPNPLVGPNIDELGPRFLDMSEPYDRDLIDEALSAARKIDISLRKGTYVAVTGPTYETPAEYNYFRIIGGDAVGMSTVPEVIVARHMNVRCFAISVITDMGVPGEIHYLTHNMVQQAAAATEPRMAAIVKRLIASLAI